MLPSKGLNVSAGNPHFLYSNAAASAYVLSEINGSEQAQENYLKQKINVSVAFSHFRHVTTSLKVKSSLASGLGRQPCSFRTWSHIQEPLGFLLLM